MVHLHVHIVSILQIYFLLDWNLVYREARTLFFDLIEWTFLNGDSPFNDLPYFDRKLALNLTSSMKKIFLSINPEIYLSIISIFLIIKIVISYETNLVCKPCIVTARIFISLQVISFQNQVSLMNSTSIYFNMNINTTVKGFPIKNR